MSRHQSLFRRVFLYTALFAILLVGITAAVLLPQLFRYRSQVRMYRVVVTFNEQFSELYPGEGFQRAAELFDFRQSFPFYITDQKNTVLYQSRDAAEVDPETSPHHIALPLDRQYILHANQDDVLVGDYREWILQAVGVALAVFLCCIAGSYVFARRIVRPIQRLAENTRKMARLEDVPPPPESGDELSALVRDVHGMYRKLQAELAKKDEAAESQRYFFAAASHELKTPIAATSALLEAMLAGVGDYADTGKYLRECLKLQGVQADVVSEILDIVKLTQGGIVPETTQVNLYQLLLPILTIYEPLARSEGILLSNAVPRNLQVITAPAMLGRAISNLLANAVQNTPKGGEVRVYWENGLNILNTGTHIEEKDLARLTEPFYRVDKARSRKDGHSGLGLTLVAKTLEVLNLTYQLTNTPEGVLFHIDL